MSTHYMYTWDETVQWTYSSLSQSHGCFKQRVCLWMNMCARELPIRWSGGWQLWWELYCNWNHKAAEVTHTYKRRLQCFDLNYVNTRIVSKQMCLARLETRRLLHIDTAAWVLYGWVQSEAKNLRDQQGLQAELVKKFESASNELESTKDTLAATLAQLADKTSSANTAQTNMAQAHEALQVTHRPL